MNIGFDCKRAFSNNTGLGNYSRDTINLLSNHYPNEQYFLFTPKFTKNKRIEFIKKKENLFIRTPISNTNKIFKSLWRSKNIVNDLLKENIQIYHGLSNEIPLGIEKTEIKTIVTIHDLIFIRYPKLFNKIDRYIYYYKFKSSCERANKIIAVSEQTKKDIIEYFSIPEEKIKVVYQGCNEIFQVKKSNVKINKTIKKYALPKDFILYVGSIEKRKNLKTLLKCIKDLEKEKLVVIGNGNSYKKECKSYILENKFKKRVTFLNDISLEDMSCIYQSAKLMVYPSIFEGFGIPILEALFSKVPVITSKDGCFKEAGGNTSKYINPLSIEEMKEAILEIGNSKKIQKKMKEQGYIHAQKFADKKISDNLMQVYTSML